MNDQTQAQQSPSKKQREVEKVQMTDGREVEFVGKQKILKEGVVILPDGSHISVDDASDTHLSSGELAVRMDFRNGATRLYPLNRSILHRYAVHGALQKYGDQLAGGVKKPDGTESEDLDDWALETDALHEQLTKGEWARTRVGGGGGGTSVLLQALMEFTGKDLATIKEHIKDWTPQQKLAVRNSPELKPIVERIEKEKAEKAGHVDTSALVGGLKALVG